jgi:lipopolysaccharide assembly outer membrane protein LptD (OstA)
MEDDEMNKWALAIILTALALAPSHAQDQRPEFGRVPGLGPDGKPQGTAFTGRADTTEVIGDVITVRGNVTLVFPGAQLVLRADQASFDPVSKELTFTGNVQVKLDSK